MLSAISSLLGVAAAAEVIRSIPAPALAQCWRDVIPPPDDAPAPEQAVFAVADWIGRAQDSSSSRDGGVARHFSLKSGWSTSYPETTGYIVPTMLVLWRRTQDATYRHRAVEMLRFLQSIQLPSGAFQGGVIGATPAVPVVFNTGQILLGLAAAVRELGDEYRPAMTKAADFLVACQEPDGSWRRYATPFACQGVKSYDTHVSWALLEAERVAPDRGYADAALRNVAWALTHQRRDGWIDHCCLTDRRRPLTHTIGYFLRGVLEAFEFTQDPALLDSARRLADRLLDLQRPDGTLPGRLTGAWEAAVTSTCLTGNSQIAHCWLRLYVHTGNSAYLHAATRANRFARRTLATAPSHEARGGLRGSYPAWGDYAPYEYINWGAKFFIDAQLLELDLTAAARPD